ncbi:MAG: aconitase X catalytic domain-containing protein [Gemmatimonadales bacterium]|nr:aconitase X catalytic domain-containing protein [Gemmatimonadales bacterium]
MADLQLTDPQRAQLSGEAGPAAALAMRLVVRMAEMTGATNLTAISRAHIDGCLYHGPASVDFARTLADGGGTVTVPTTLNVGAVDLLHPELFRGKAEVAAAARAMMRYYQAMGCRQTWTCAPYQLRDRPGLGEQIAWAESNAIVFANSVLGARTERYGDFIDICAAIVGHVPMVGLHTDAGRRARVVVRLRQVPTRLLERDTTFAALGHVLGPLVGGRIPVIVGLDSASEDQLKALGAAAASSGSVAMFHVAGVTPEAPTEAAALGGAAPEVTFEIGRSDLRDAVRALTSTTTRQLGAVSVGTPHFSHAEFVQLRELLGGRRIATEVEFFVSTGRDTLARIRDEGWEEELRSTGLQIVTDTCTYITPILSGRPGAVMTNSAKWAWYAPNNLGYQVVFASLEECVESAVAGRVWRDESVWEDQ